MTGALSRPLKPADVSRAGAMHHLYRLSTQAQHDRQSLIYRLGR